MPATHRDCCTGNTVSQSCTNVWMYVVLLYNTVPLLLCQMQDRFLFGDLVAPRTVSALPLLLPKLAQLQGCTHSGTSGAGSSSTTAPSVRNLNRPTDSGPSREGKGGAGGIGGGGEPQVAVCFPDAGAATRFRRELSRLAPRVPVIQCEKRRTEVCP